MYADLHCHPSMKPFSVSSNGENSKNVRDKRSIWNTDSNFEIKLEKMIESIIPVAKYKQADFQKADSGNVRLIFLSITPPETDFFKIKFVSAIKFLKQTIGVFVPDFVTEFGARKIRKIKGIGSEVYDYFEELEMEYDYIRQMDGETVTINGDNKKYVLIKNYNHLRQILESNDSEDTIAIVLSIEGGHALISGDAHKVIKSHPLSTLNNLDHPKTKQLLQSIEQNIGKVKAWSGKDGNDGDHCPLFVTFDHHFWNLLSGHAPSIPGILNKILDQTKNINTGMTELGKETIKSLLSKENGKRILIDTKHMSVASKKWFYQYIEDHNNEHPEDKIPAISSHSGVNGMDKMDKSDEGEVKKKRFLFWTRTKVIADKKYNKSTRFNNWSINLSDEEISRINDSGGLIGISLDQRIISGKQAQDKVKKISKRDPEYHQEWARLVYNQLEHIFGTIYDYRQQIYPDESEKDRAQKALANMTIGSDFDGIINPIDGFRTFKAYGALADQLNKLVSENIENYHGLTADEVVGKIMYENADRFLKEHFNNS